METAPLCSCKWHTIVPFGDQLQGPSDSLGLWSGTRELGCRLCRTRHADRLMALPDLVCADGGGGRFSKLRRLRSSAPRGKDHTGKPRKTGERGEEPEMRADLSVTTAPSPCRKGSKVMMRKRRCCSCIILLGSSTCARMVCVCGGGAATVAEAWAPRWLRLAGHAPVVVCTVDGEGLRWAHRQRVPGHANFGSKRVETRPGWGSFGLVHRNLSTPTRSSAEDYGDRCSRPWDARGKRVVRPSSRLERQRGLSKVGWPGPPRAQTPSGTPICGRPGRDSTARQNAGAPSVSATTAAPMRAKANLPAHLAPSPPPQNPHDGAPVGLMCLP